MTSEMIYAFCVILLPLAGLVFLSFISWLVFCYAIARLPNGEAQLRQAPQVIEAFDIKSWGDVLLPWRIIERVIRWIIRLATRNPGGVGGGQGGQQPATALGPGSQEVPPEPPAGP
ncbi:hypothetical protein [Micromonospora sp. WMMD987]|uniref:hypothetical protein n=1 Tax=Micromonospora sp. WMMD987 TaxID=3016089 RepID=UPI00249BDD10|nr:hypothetical protein [Micromonospora sp. WMMD987]WFE95627.1 hypothetical protein O7612_01420 [Micromonospora sp. WMMD987]